ncbi:MAG: hypothetical protein LZF86_100307 [Nitrospira sp.]|nr:MAG: hypothetical protein LZF86_100307 [Nitrospira sp.]
MAGEPSLSQAVGKKMAKDLTQAAQKINTYLTLTLSSHLARTGAEAAFLTH